VDKKALSVDIKIKNFSSFFYPQFPQPSIIIIRFLNEKKIYTLLYLLRQEGIRLENPGAHLLGGNLANGSHTEGGFFFHSYEKIFP